MSVHWIITMWTVVSLAILIMRCEFLFFFLCFQAAGVLSEELWLQDARHSTVSATNKHSEEMLLEGLYIRILAQRQKNSHCMKI